MPPRGRRDGRDVQELAGVVLDAGEKHDGDLAPAPLDQLDQIFRPQERLARARRDPDQPLNGIDAMKGELRLRGVGVGGEGAVFDQDLVAGTHRPEERRHHEVEIHGQPVHHHHLVRERADQARARLAKRLVIRKPGRLPGEMRINRERRPIVQFVG